MGKVVPFKRISASLDEELRERLDTNPDDLEALAELFLLKVEDGNFNPESDYAKGIIRCIKTGEVSEIELFLKRTCFLMEGMYWPKQLKPSPDLEKRHKEFKEKFPNFPPDPASLGCRLRG